MCKPDKGRGVVIVDRDTYLQKMTHIISDKTKFTEITDSIQVYTLRIEDKINRFLSKLKSLSLITDQVYKQLYVSGSSPGILYGLPKIHKPNFSTAFPFRPIFAAYNTASYKLAKFLVPVLAPLTTNEYTTDNSYSFVQNLLPIDNADDLFMASFDVENLFTNVPLAETINICINKLFTTDQTTVIGLTKKYFKMFLEHSVMNSFFMFDSKLYKQNEGLGMGLPLGPTFSNIFMCHHEQQWLDDCPYDFKPVFYQRYIDDTFLLFRDRSHPALFLKYLNEKHENINFTMELENNGQLSFLDVCVSRSNNKFLSSIYRKQTFSGQGISYFSFCSFSFKVNAIKTLLHRAYNISSNYVNFHSEVEFLKKFFTDNGFPVGLFLTHVKKFLAKKYDPIEPTSSSADNFIYFSLNYFGPQSEKLKTDLQALFQKYFTNVNFRIILTNSFKVGSFFNYKDRLPCDARSSVIYSYVCPICGAQYVGSTCRMFSSRRAEHMGLSHRTGRRLALPSHSSPRQHCEQSHDAAIVPDSFKILASHSANDSSVSIRLLESLYIHNLRPVLNETNSAYPLYIVK